MEIHLYSSSGVYVKMGELGKIIFSRGGRVFTLGHKKKVPVRKTEILTPNVNLKALLFILNGPEVHIVTTKLQCSNR